MGKEWYLRVRGKVTGPFTGAEIEGFRTRGQLQPFHEVSRDEQSWQSVGSWRVPSEAQASLPPGDELLPAIPSLQLTAAKGDGIPGRELSSRTVRKVAAVACVTSAILGAAIVWVVDAGTVSEMERKLADQEAVRDKLERDFGTLGDHRDHLARQAKGLQHENDFLADKLKGATKDREKLEKLLDKARQEAAGSRAVDGGRRQTEAELELNVNANKRLVAEIDKLKAELEVGRKQREKRTLKLASVEELVNPIDLPAVSEEIREGIRELGKARARGDLGAAALYRAKAKRLCDQLEQKVRDPEGKRRVEILRKAVRDTDRGN